MKLLELALVLALSARSWSAQTEGQLSTSIAEADTSFYLDSRGAISTLQGATPKDHLQEAHELLIQRFEEGVTQSQQSYDVQRNPQPSVNTPYQWAYEVNAASTGDKKSQVERREEDGIVRGRYSVLDPDGSLRVVTYMAHPDDGFQATVDKQVGFQEPIDTESLIVLAYNSGQQDILNLDKQTSASRQRPSSITSQRQELRRSQQKLQPRYQYEQQDQKQKLQLRNQPISAERRQNQPQRQNKYINQQQNYKNQNNPTVSQQIRQPHHQYSFEEKLQDSYQGQQTSLIQNWPRLGTGQQEKYHHNDQQLEIRKEQLQGNYRGTAQRYRKNHEQDQVISRTHQGQQQYRVEQEHLQKQQFANQQQHNSRAQDQLQYGDKNQNQPQIIDAQQKYRSEQLTHHQQQNSQPSHISIRRDNEQERKLEPSQHQQSIELDSDKKILNNYEIYAQAKLKLDEHGSYNIVPIILRRVS